MSRWLVVLCLPALSIAAVSGCGSSGPKMYEVSGTVTFDDKPIPAGDIKFVPEASSQGAEAGKIVDGKYHLKVKGGMNKVEIRAVRPSGKKDPMGTGGELPEDYIPERYNLKTTLSADVGEGKTEFPFPLTSK